MQFKYVPMPAAQETLVAYVVHLAGRLQPSSIPGYLNVIRLLHLEAGMENSLKENWELLLIKIV